MGEIQVIKVACFEKLEPKIKAEPIAEKNDRQSKIVLAGFILHTSGFHGTLYERN